MLQPPQFTAAGVIVPQYASTCCCPRLIYLTVLPAHTYSSQPCAIDPQRMLLACIRCLRVSFGSSRIRDDDAARTAAASQATHRLLTGYSQTAPAAALTHHKPCVSAPPHQLLTQPLHSSRPCVMIHIRNSPSAALASFVSQCYQRMPLADVACVSVVSHVAHTLTSAASQAAPAATTLITAVCD